MSTPNFGNMQCKIKFDNITQVCMQFDWLQIPNTTDQVIPKVGGAILGQGNLNKVKQPICGIEAELLTKLYWECQKHLNGQSQVC